jgi:peroxiredoxin
VARLPVAPGNSDLCFEWYGLILLKRMALIIDDGVIAKVFYPVFPPDQSATEVVSWLRQSPR